MMHGWNGGGWAPGGYGFGFPWGGLVMGLCMLIVVGLAIFAIVKLARRPAFSGIPLEGRPSGGKALEILAERFAKGEVDAETYRSMKAELEAKD